MNTELSMMLATLVNIAHPEQRKIILDAYNKALALEKRVEEADAKIAAIKADFYKEGRDIVFRYSGWQCDYHDMAGEAVAFMHNVKDILGLTAPPQDE